MTPQIFITQRIPNHGPDLLLENFGQENIDYNNTDGVLPKTELIARAQKVDVLMPLLTDKIDEEFLTTCPGLKLIANCAVGYNNIDVQAAVGRRILVSNTPGVLDETTADFAFTLLMAIARRVVEADGYMRAGKFKCWEPMGFLGQDIHNATLGVIGMGRIGKEMARRGAKGFNMKVLYYDPEELNNLDFEAQKVDLDELLKQSDFVSLHVPLLEKTLHLIGERELGLMKKTACLINTARGPVVDEKALYEALKNDQIAGAALDVYEKEPEFYPGLNELPNIIMVPHIASASWATRQKMSLLAAQNIVDWAEGKTPRTLVPECRGLI